MTAGGPEQAVGVPGGVGVEADEVTRVVHAVDIVVAPSRAGSLTVLNPVRRVQVKPYVLALEPLPVAYVPDDLALVVDAEGLGHRGAGIGQRVEVARGHQEPSVVPPAAA